MKKRIIAVAVALMLLAGAAAMYLSDVYPAGEKARACLEGSDAVRVRGEGGCLFLDGPGEGDALVFYPGAKVEYIAYLPLLTRLAEDGVDCFLVKMPANLALLGRDAAGKVMAEYGYDRWYLAGHSLGGAAAAIWAAEHGGGLEGLVLLAAYPTKPLPEGLRVLELYGGEDGVLNRSRLAAGDAYLPVGAEAEALPGGNHAGFGDYGPQKGDGAASVTPEEQWAWAAERIEALVREAGGPEARPSETK